MKFIRRLSRSLWLVPAVALSALALSACGSSSSGSSSSGTTTVAAGGSGNSVAVTLKNYSVTLAGGDNLAPGTYTFNVSNQGPSSHNLTISGPGVAKQATPTFAAGGTQTLTVTLQNGTYQFYCSVPGHKQLGMLAQVTVGSGGGGGATGTGGTSSGGSSSSGGGWS
jgi:plastocyanin